MTVKKYQNFNKNNVNFVEMEKNVLEFWRKERIFEKTLKQTEDMPKYVFYDGPPFANGLPHYGHLLTSCAKDTIGRFQTMNGKYVERKFGWDCHGLPAEMAAEKALKISGKKNIEEFGIDKFNDYCKTDVMKFSQEWKKYIERIGRWVDMENSYKTMDLNFMESILWAFKNLYDKGLVYQEMRVMPYSWACQTPLSNFETRLDNSYRQKESKSLIVKFELKNENLPDKLRQLNVDKIYILVWTTTPWTLPSNLALAINSKLDYQVIIDQDNIAYIANNISQYFNDLKISEQLQKNIININGSILLNLSYYPLFDYFVNKISENCFHIADADFVSAEDGTGVVHIAPGFGEEDFNLCQANQIGLKIFDENNSIKCRIIPAVPVDDDGCFTKEIRDFYGMHVFEANDEIIKKLKINNNWVKTSQYLHSYPHCWRTDTPIIYKAMPSYYIRVSSSRERLCELNSQINWIPETIRDGMFGNWLKEARDWAISRNRFFGTPLPVWVSDNDEYPCIKVFGSIQELEDFFGEYYEKQNNIKLEIKDLHRPFIDTLIAPNPNDPTGQSKLRRITDVFDCWFESGAMSFAEVHYPFNQSSHQGPQYKYDSIVKFNPQIYTPKRLPADFIVEYTAQTRGWFYTLMVLSTLIFDQIPFKNCICHGVILDDKGQKLSKRLGNYIDPLEAMEEYGADTLRYVMLSSPVMSGGELLIDKEGRMLADALRLVHKPIWSSINFFIMYAREDQPDISLIDLQTLVKWSDDIEGKEYDWFIVFKAIELNVRIYEYLGQYKIMQSYNLLRDFIDDLNNFYIRANRNRFWAGMLDEDKQRAYNCLYSALYYLSIAIAPIMPYFAEIIWQNIQDNFEKSVHLQQLIANDNLLIEFNELGLKQVQFLNNMQMLKKIFYHGRSLRDDKLNIRIRQPLLECKIITNISTIENSDNFFIKQIENELNIKKTSIIHANDGNSIEIKKYFNLKIKLNNRELGPKLGKKLIIFKKNLDEGRYCVSLGGDLVVFTEEFGEYKFGHGEFFTEIELDPLLEKNCVVAYNFQGEYIILWMNPVISAELAIEGMMRDLTRSIQDARKTCLEITDRIELYVWSEDIDLIKACNLWKDYIVEQTLSTKFIFELINDPAQLKKFEDSIVTNDMAIFGYQISNSLTNREIDLKLSFKKCEL